MSVYSGLFILSLLIYVIVFLVKIFNLMSLFREKKEYDLCPYDMRFSFLLFFISMISYLLGLVVMMLKPDLLTSILFRVESGLLLFNILFLFAEIIHYLTVKHKAAESPKSVSFESYKSLLKR